MALSGNAFQSSNFSATQYLASNGNNGITTDFTHTASDDTNSTWTLAFAANTTVEQIVLHNRDSSCCVSRFRDITVTMYDGSSNTVYDSGLLNPGNVLNSPETITLDLSAPTNAVTLQVHRTPDAGNSVLSLGEVIVNGCTAP